VPEGAKVGKTEGITVWVDDGVTVGCNEEGVVGTVVAKVVGKIVGAGITEGANRVGAVVGVPLGVSEGSWLEETLGCPLGVTEGLSPGATLQPTEGVKLGERLGTALIKGEELTEGWVEFSPSPHAVAQTKNKVIVIRKSNIFTYFLITPSPLLFFVFLFIIVSQCISERQVDRELRKK